MDAPAEAGGVTGELVRPRGDDWGFRPGSPSERFVEPGEEARLAGLLREGGPNYPALLGLGLALFGFLAGLWGLVLAAGGFVLSSVGLWLAAGGARWRLAALAGVAVSLVYLVGHIAELT